MNTIKDDQQLDVPRWHVCPACDLKNLPDKNKGYTREEVRTHITEMHAGWTFCKGCDEPITPWQSEEEKGWCEDCVLRCYDCLDEEKNGPYKPLDFPSARTDAEVASPEPEDPGPPPTWRDWLTPILYKGTRDRENRLLSWIRKLFT